MLSAGAHPKATSHLISLFIPCSQHSSCSFWVFFFFFANFNHFVHKKPAIEGIDWHAQEAPFPIHRKRSRVWLYDSRACCSPIAVVCHIHSIMTSRGDQLSIWTFMDPRLNTRHRTWHSGVMDQSRSVIMIWLVKNSDHAHWSQHKERASRKDAEGTGLWIPLLLTSLQEQFFFHNYSAPSHKTVFLYVHRFSLWTRIGFQETNLRVLFLPQWASLQCFDLSDYTVLTCFLPSGSVICALLRPKQKARCCPLNNRKLSPGQIAWIWQLRAVRAGVGQQTVSTTGKVPKKWKTTYQNQQDQEEFLLNSGWETTEFVKMKKSPSCTEEHETAEWATVTPKSGFNAKEPDFLLFAQHLVFSFSSFSGQFSPPFVVEIMILDAQLQILMAVALLVVFLHAHVIQKRPRITWRYAANGYAL